MLYLVIRARARDAALKYWVGNCSSRKSLNRKPCRVLQLVVFTFLFGAAEFTNQDQKTHMKETRIALIHAVQTLTMGLCSTDKVINRL